MRHFGKRAFALILALMLCLSLFPSALAEDAGSIAAAGEPEQEGTIAPEKEGDIIPAEEGTIAPADEGTIRPAEEGDALPRTDEIQDGETSGKCGDGLTWSLDDYGTLTISGTGEMWNWTKFETAWPSTPWQATVSRITSISIEPGVTSIGDYAFYGCQNMTDVAISETVSRIGADAFDSCSGLLSLTIPEGVTSIDAYAFRSCVGLKCIELPSSLSLVEGNMFYSCSSLTDIDYGGTIAEWKNLGADYARSQVTVHCTDGDLSPADAASCGDNLVWSLSDDGILTISGSGDMWNFGYGQTPWWSQNSQIKDIRLASGVTSIGNFAFYSCRNLNSVTFPKGLTRVGDCAFLYCDSLRSVTIPETVWSIGDSAFLSCRQLSSVTLPEGLTRIGSAAFGYCESLWVLTLPETVTSIGDRAFERTSLYSFVIPEGVTRIQNDTFSECAQLTSVIIPETVTEIGDDAFVGCYNLPEVTLPQHLTSLGDNSFYNCGSLKSITIPASVTNIGAGAFSWCSSLVNISVASANPNYTSVGGILFSKDRTVLLAYPGGKSGEYIIPSGVKEIGSRAFRGCEMLSGVTIPESVTSIGSAAFLQCYRLKSITIPSSVNRIGNIAFAATSPGSIRFLGSAPLFESNGGGNQFGGVTATAYYPAGDTSWTKEVRQDYGGTITWAAYGGTLSLGVATACVGRAFTVELMLDENPGVMALSFQLDYDASVMTFVGAEEGALTGWTVNVQKNALVWDSDQDWTGNGCLLKLKFRMKADTTPGEASIGLTNLTVGNYNEDNLYFEVRPGQITVLVHRPGDGNGDGKVNVNDLIRLRKYLAGAEKEIIEGNADVNADDLVDILDLVRLRKYLALEDVILE